MIWRSYNNIIYLEKQIPERLKIIKLAKDLR